MDAIAEKLTIIAENQTKVYESGKQSNYDKFWDAYQNNGKRRNYQNAFSGIGWNNDTFNPKYDIIVDKNSSSGAYMMFRFSQIEGDLVEILDKLGIVLDMSNNSAGNALNYAFQGSYFTRIGEIYGNATAHDQTFAQATYLETIDLYSSTSGKFEKFTNTFQGCTALREIRFGSMIECNLDIHWSTLLSAGSLESIVSHLSGDTTGYTVTLPTTAEANYDAVYGEGAWAALVGTKTNWTIAYA